MCDVFAILNKITKQNSINKIKILICNLKSKKYISGSADQPTIFYTYTLFFKKNNCLSLINRIGLF